MPGENVARSRPLVERPPALAGTTLDELMRGGEITEGEEADPAGVTLLAPVESQEVWACGVTYLRSRAARMEESVTADVYARAYEAERPEIFFKSAGWRVVGHHGDIGIRADSTWKCSRAGAGGAVESRRRGGRVCRWQRHELAQHRRRE